MNNKTKGNYAKNKHFYCLTILWFMQKLLVLLNFSFAIFCEIFLQNNHS